MQKIKVRYVIFNIAFTIHDVLQAVCKQKQGKAAGPDGLAMDAFLYGGHRLYTHLCILFNVFF